MLDFRALSANPFFLSANPGDLFNPGLQTKSNFSQITVS